MTDHSENGMNAVLVGLDMGVSSHTEDLGELIELASSAGLNPVDQIGGKRMRPDAATFAGSGKVEEIALAVKARCAGAQFGTRPGGESDRSDRIDPGNLRPAR
jgi:GTPase